MKIVYIENIRLPTEKAHGIQIMKMCEAFANNGHEVVLIIPNRKNDIKNDPFKYYDVKENFKIKRIWAPDILFLKSLGFWLQTLIFSEIASWYIRSFRPDIVYSREEKILLNYVLIFKNLVWETHRGSLNITVRIINKFVKNIITISYGLRNLYIEDNKKLDNKIFVAPDGVDLNQFDIKETKEYCRNQLSLPKDKKIILYTGHLYKWKGVYTLADAAGKLRDNCLIVFVGGTEYDVNDFKKIYGSNNKCLILGQKNHSEIPYFLKASDVLVLPNSGEDKIGSIYTSPLKLFEYMASGVPIVASGVPAILEILNDNNSTIFSPDSVQDLVDKINLVLNGGDNILDKVKNAKHEVIEYSWQNRAKDIINFVSSDQQV